MLGEKHPVKSDADRITGQEFFELKKGDYNGKGFPCSR